MEGYEWMAHSTLNFFSYGRRRISFGQRIFGRSGYVVLSWFLGYDRFLVLLNS